MRPSLLTVAVLVPLFPVPPHLVAEVLEREVNMGGARDQEPTDACLRQNEEDAGVARSQSETERGRCSFASGLQTIGGASRRWGLVRWVLGRFCVTETRHPPDRTSERHRKMKPTNSSHSHCVRPARLPLLWLRRPYLLRTSKGLLRKGEVNIMSSETHAPAAWIWRHPNPGERHTSRKRPRHLPGPALLVAAIPLLCTVLLPAGSVLAQEGRASKETPARIANIWGGFDHQPTESQVLSAERARGAAPSAQQQSREAQIVQQLYQQLLNSAGAHRTGASAG